MIRKLIGAAAFALALGVVGAEAQIPDLSKYPDWSGQWRRPPGVGIQFDQTKPLGRGQEAPLTPEYQKIYEAGLADQRAGGQGTDPTYRCIPFGMPRMTSAIFPFEILIVPKATYILSDYNMPRRIHTDGRDFPAGFEPNCSEDNHQVLIGKENYFLGGDGLLMPTKKNQPKPDLRYFNQTQK